MTRFNIEHISELPDRIYVELDRRFNVALIRTETGLDIRVYPRSGDELWHTPFDIFTVNEQEIIVLEGEMAS